MAQQVTKLSSQDIPVAMAIQEENGGVNYPTMQAPQQQPQMYHDQQPILMPTTQQQQPQMVMHGIPVVQATIVGSPHITRGFYEGKFPTMPIHVNCPRCRMDVTTVINSQPGLATWASAGVLCIVCWPLVCVPFCVRDLQDLYHICPSCGALIGTRRPL
jgi:lipopolysaccharide-induced tumor necrosis factor-alpha factor